ncbi:MAG: hypothetical protein LBD91_04955 [Prevotellaceae bacterium]|jgi:hypothetical protein|nr:hypothetical protein [Prevotellaceae bacterium]
MRTFILTDDFKQMPFVVPEKYFETFKVRKFNLTDEFKRVPFTVPETYFETLEVRKPVALTPEYKQIPFTVPVNYFDTLPLRIAERITTPAPRPVAIYWQTMRMRVSFAAILILLITVGIGLLPFSSQTPPTIHSLHRPATLTEVTSTELDLYAIDEQTLFHAVATMSPTKQPSSDFYDDAIMYYLTNNSDISLTEIASLYY